MSIVSDQLLKELRMRVEALEFRLKTLEQRFLERVSPEKQADKAPEVKIDRRTREWKNANLPRS